MKHWCSPELYPQHVPNASSAPFPPLLFRQGGKEGAAGGTSETASTERAAAVRDVSYPLSPFPPFQTINASLVYVLGLASTERAATVRDVSYPLSPFPPFQSINAFPVYGLWLGLDGFAGNFSSFRIKHQTAPFRSNGAVRIHMARAVILRK